MSEAIQHANASIFDLKPRPALAGKQPLIRNGFSLEPLFGGHVVHALAKSDDSELAGFLRSTLSNDPFLVRAVSPGQRLIVGDETLTHADAQALANKLKPHANIVDQSHGRVRLVLQGPQAERVLAKGTAVDLALQAFPVGYAAITLIGHIGAHITRTGDDHFELIVLRSFAESLWDVLDHMSREFI